jgi:hypothetical protein
VLGFELSVSAFGSFHKANESEKLTTFRIVAYYGLP